MNVQRELEERREAVRRLADDACSDVALARSIVRQWERDTRGEVEPDAAFVAWNRAGRSFAALAAYCRQQAQHVPTMRQLVQAKQAAETAAQAVLARPGREPERCPGCGGARRWETLEGGGVDAVCGECGRRGAHDVLSPA